MTRVIEFLQGKKTYIVSGALAIAAVVFFFSGRIDAPQLTVILAAAAGLSTIGAKFQRYLPGVVQTLEDIKNKNATGVLLDVTKIATEGSGPAPAANLKS
jgi:nitrate/nitrite transporter NarK